MNQVVIQHFSLPLGSGSVSRDKVRTPEQVDAAIRAAYPPCPSSSAPHAPAAPASATDTPAATITSAVAHAPGVDDTSGGLPSLKAARTGGEGGEGGGAGATAGAEAGDTGVGDVAAGGGVRLRLVRPSERSSKALKRGQVPLLTTSSDTMC